MNFPEIATGAITATSTTLVTLAAANEGWDAATITIVGAVVCTIITALSVAIVKILGALQEMKVALIKAADDRAKVAEKTAENSDKLNAIGAKADGTLSDMGKRLDDALRRMDEMQKAALVKATVQPALPESPDKPVEMKIINPPEDPANVTNIKPKTP